MANLYSDYQSLIKFVTAAPANSNQVEEASNKPEVTKAALTGDEAKVFYETLVSEDKSTNLNSDESLTIVPNISKKVKTVNKAAAHIDSASYNIKVEVKDELDKHSVNANSHRLQAGSSSNVTGTNIESLREVHKKLLLYSQNGEIEPLKKLVRCEQFIDLNFQDQYGWTALMCASVGKHKHVVKYLLANGADKKIVNKAGKTAADLCEDIHAYSLRDTIFLYSAHERSVDKPTSSFYTSENIEFFCEICKTSFKETTEKSHLSSTVHLFNLKLKPKTDTFMIPETNIGYRLMKRSGWDGEAGLGPEGAGQKFPVKTMLKKDRACIGAKKPASSEAKITHFGPNDTRAVQSGGLKTQERIMSVRTASKKAKQRQTQKDKEWERKLRLYMNLD